MRIATFNVMPAHARTGRCVGAGRPQALVGGEPPWPALDADKAAPWLEQRDA